MFLIPFLFIGALGLIVWALVQFSGNGASDSAVAIARRRFASGEISSDEFQQIQHNLGAQPSRPGRGIALVVVPIVGLLLLAMAGSIAGWAGSWGWGWGNTGQMMGNMGGMMGGGGPPGSITVRLQNWSVTPSQPSARAGSITFHAVHSMMDMMRRSTEGGATHDLQVMQKNADGSFELVGQVQGLRPGEAKDLTLDLAPGDYELSCNVTEELKGKVVAHYVKGMHIPFKVI